MNKTSNKHWAVCIYLALALTTLVVFWQVRSYDFVNYDDTDYASENLHVQAGLTYDSVIWAFTTAKTGNWHPLTWMSHMLDYQLFGTDPGWFHLTNLLLHIANTLLLFAVFRRMTGALWRSAFVAAAFALHPLHVESVAWISERKDVLSTLFWILTMAWYLRYVERPGVGRYLLTLLAFALGLMAKPMLVTLPFVLLLLDYWPLGRFEPGQAVKDTNRRKYKSVKAGSQWRVSYRLVLEKVPFFVLSAISSVVTFLVQRSGGAVVRIDMLSPGIRISNAFISYLRYIGKMIWPSHLAIFYPHPDERLSTWQAGAAALLLLGISVCVIRLARSRRYLPVGWLWYLGTLVPVIGLVQVGGQALADRYTYVPLTGLFIIIAWGLPELLTKWQYRKIGLGVSAGLLLVAMLICTRIQVRYWRDSLTLSGHALEVTKNNCVMHTNYGCALFERGQLDQAIAHFKEALRINPNHFNARRNIGNVFLKQGKLDEAIANLTEALPLRKDKPEVYYYLGLAYARQGKYDLAVQNYNEALLLKPDYPDAINHLAAALKKQGKISEAINEWKKVLRFKPDDFNAYYNLAMALEEQGKIDEAIEKWKKALEIEPGHPYVHFYLGAIYCKQGRLDLAITHWTEAVKLKLNFADALNNLAWIFATSQDAKVYNPLKAVKFAKRACELTEYSRPDFLDTLAVAHAAAGNFSEAIRTAEKALELAQSSEQKELIEEIREHLLLYKAGKPYIEPSPRPPSERN